MLGSSRSSSYANLKLVKLPDEKGSNPRTYTAQHLHLPDRAGEELSLGLIQLALGKDDAHGLVPPLLTPVSSRHLILV